MFNEKYTGKNKQRISHEMKVLFQHLQEWQKKTMKISGQIRRSQNWQLNLKPPMCFRHNHGPLVHDVVLKNRNKLNIQNKFL